MKDRGCHLGRFVGFLSRAKILHCLQFGLGQEEEVGSSCDKKPPIQRAPLDKIVVFLQPPLTQGVAPDKIMLLSGKNM